MMHRNFLTGSYLIAIICFAALSTGAARAQHRILWQGAVKPDRINVYSQPSTNQSVVRTLGHGQVVNVVLEVRVLDFAWCRIGFPRETEPLGYVLCMNLQQGNFTSKGKNQDESAAEPSTERPPDPSVLTNRDILDMNKAGLSSEVLIAKIKSTECKFDTSPGQLAELKTSGIPDAVILAMVQAPSRTAGARSMSTDIPPAAANTGAATTPEAPSSDGKIRVFVTDSQSWETRGGSSAGGSRNGWGASSWMSGGARPQTAEIIKTLNQRCPQITVTDNPAKADFALILDHEGGKALLARRNKIALFNGDGDVIFSRSTRELGNAVKDACQAVLSARN